MNLRKIRAIVLDQKRLEFLTALDEQLKKVFAAEPRLTELRLAANQLIRLIRDARLPVWTYSDRELCKVVGDSLYWRDGPLHGRNEYLADGGRSGYVIFQRKYV